MSKFEYLFTIEVAAVLEVFEGIVGSGGWRKQHHPTLRRVRGAPGDYLRVVVLDEKLRIEN